jgi:hypothetical protein
MNMSGPSLRSALFVKGSPGHGISGRRTIRRRKLGNVEVAVTAIGASATLQIMGKRSASVFVGQWAPTLLILGLYNKLVKQHGSDFTDAGTSV